MTSWAKYVERVAGTDVSTEIAKATGINQSSVYRWLKDGAVPSTAHAARFAQAYGRNVLEAFVAAEFLTAEEAGTPPGPLIDLTLIPGTELAMEIHRRFAADTPSATIHPFPSASGNESETSEGAGTTDEQEAADTFHASQADIEREQQELTEDP